MHGSKIIPTPYMHRDRGARVPKLLNNHRIPGNQFLRKTKTLPQIFRKKGYIVSMRTKASYIARPQTLIDSSIKAGGKWGLIRKVTFEKYGFIRLYYRQLQGRKRLCQFKIASFTPPNIKAKPCIPGKIVLHRQPRKKLSPHANAILPYLIPQASAYRDHNAWTKILFAFQSQSSVPSGYEPAKPLGVPVKTSDDVTHFQHPNGSRATATRTEWSRNAVRSTRLFRHSKPLWKIVHNLPRSPKPP